MKPKKIVFDIVVISIAFFLFTVWYKSSIGSSTPASSMSLIRFYDVYLITTDEQYEFWEMVNKGAADMAALTGIKYKWVVPKDRDPEKQNKLIIEAVEDGADALLIAADNPKLISGVVEDAKARGVKIIYVDSPAAEEAITILATDNYDAGVAAAEAMIAHLKEKEILGGSIGVVSIATKVTTAQREKGFRDTIKAKTDFKLLDTTLTNGEPENVQLAAERIMIQDKDLIGLFATNEGTTEGIGNAIRENDNKYIGVGFDKSEKTMQLLKEGSLKTIINQNPYTMGYLGMAEAIAAVLRKQTGPDYIDTGFTIIDDSNH